MQTREAPDSWGLHKNKNYELSSTMPQKAYKGYCQSVFSSTGYILTNLKTPVRNLKTFK